jgi:serine/threonine protein kinase
MSTAVHASLFLDTLRKSSLYDEEAYADLLHMLQQAGLAYADGNTMAQWLVQYGYLTRFQAQQLLAGKWKNFVVNRKYLVLEPLGSGGMGAVYRCRHLTLKKDVALKVLPPQLTADPSALQRFLREARALAALNHPNIVQAHDCDVAKGQYFLVMGYVPGITLGQLVEKIGPLPVPRAAYYLAQACQGLQHAHEAGWVHRDLKPSNLEVDRTDTIKILDLGLARLMTDPSEPITKMYDEDNVLGSPDYISPEQSLNSPEVDIRTDIYSLGATLYYLLAGKPPFEGLPLMQKLLAHQMREPPDLRQKRPDVPAELVAVVQKMMAKIPGQRFATPGEAATALQFWAAQYRPSPQAVPIPTVETPERLYAAATTVRRSSQPSSNPGLGDPLFTPLPPSRSSSTGDSLLFPPEATPTTPAMISSQHTAPLYFEPAPAPSAPAYDTAASTEPEEQEPAPTPGSGRLIVILGVTVGVLLLGTALGVALWLSGDSGQKSHTHASESPLAKAEELCRQQKWAEAAEIYAKLLGQAPPDSITYRDLFTRIQAQERENMLPFLAERLPSDVYVQGALGLHYYDRKEYRKALTVFTKLTQSAPASTSTHYNWQLRAMCEVHLGQWETATASMERGMAAKPDCIACRTSLAFLAAHGQRQQLYTAQCQELLRRLDQVSEATLYSLVGMACATQGDQPRDLLDKVRDYLDRYAEGDKTCRMRFAQALLRYRLGDYALALEAMTDAEKMQGTWSGSPLLKPVKALILYKLSRREEADKIFRDLTTWRANAKKRLPTDDTSYLSNCWDTVLMETLYREAAEALR